MLNNELRKSLKRRAHSLKPVVIVGQHGVTENVMLELDRALADHELVKVRLRGIERDDRRSEIDALCENLACELVMSIGAVAVFYRENPDRQ